MDDILKLAKDYSKKRHSDLLPRGNDNILEKLDYIYDENWENQGVPFVCSFWYSLCFSLQQFPWKCCSSNEQHQCK